MYNEKTRCSQVLGVFNTVLYYSKHIAQQSVTYSKCYGYTHGSHVLAGTMLTDNEYALVFIEMFIVTINGYTFKTISSVLQFHVQTCSTLKQDVLDALHRISMLTLFGGKIIPTEKYQLRRTNIEVI